MMNELGEKFPLVEKTVTVAGWAWRLTVATDQDALLRNVETDADLDNFPYGLMLWPAALGLCARLAETPELVRNKRVLEIGAGVGLVGLVAQTLGAASVTQTDYHADALALAAHNAAQNGVGDVQIRRGDWRDWPDDLTGFDVVLGSDVLYERGLHDDLARLFPRLLVPGGLLLISDPLRPQAIEFIEREEKRGLWQASLEGRRVVWENEAKEIALFLVRQTGP